MNRSPLFALLLLSALAQHAQQTPPPKPIDRRPLSRKLECPDCGQEVLLVRSTTDGLPTLDLHFLFEDGEHMVVGLSFAIAEDRDQTFLTLTYDEAKQVFAELMQNSMGGAHVPQSLADVLGSLHRLR